MLRELRPLPRRPGSGRWVSCAWQPTYPLPGLLVIGTVRWIVFRVGGWVSVPRVRCSARLRVPTLSGI